MKKLIILLLFCFTYPYQSLCSEYNFVSICGSAEHRICEIIISDVYKKMGIEIDITRLPAKRAEYEASKGYKDGEIMRIWCYGKTNTSLVRVPTPFYQIDTVAFVKRDRNIKTVSLEDLSKYKIGKVIGVKHTCKVTEGLTNYRDFNSTEKLIKLLEAGRFDIALTGNINGIYEINRLKLVDITKIKEPLATYKLYHYIHKKKLELVSKVDKTIKEIKISGELEAIIKKAEKEILGEIDP